MVRSYGLYDFVVFRWGEVNQMLKYFVALQTRIAELRTRQEGQAYVEYAVLIAIVAIGAVALLIVFRTKLATAFSDLGDLVNGAV
jgi:Flp pilus assembly pilin Flp